MSAVEWRHESWGSVGTVNTELGKAWVIITKLAGRQTVSLQFDSSEMAQRVGGALLGLAVDGSAGLEPASRGEVEGL
jgi:hypothetical protein